MRSKNSQPNKKTGAVSRIGKSVSSGPEVSGPVSGAHRGTQPRSGAPTGRKRTAINLLEIPPLLLEGDFPAAAPVAGTGQRYALGPTPPARPPKTAPGVRTELPESYGTKQLILIARDPHWLYAHWDLSAEEQRRCNSQSAHGHLILRVRAGAHGAAPAEVHVHPESRHWFVHVRQAGMEYTSELGFYRKEGAWETVSRSAPALTPRDSMSDDLSVEFATIPYPSSQAKAPREVEGGMAGAGSSPAGAMIRRAELPPGLPCQEGPPVNISWSARQERALGRILSRTSRSKGVAGSLQIPEPAPFPAPDRPEAISSLPGPAPVNADFWFNVNAELIVYGATQPGASVSIGGAAVPLRPDGSFTCRFALPDGRHELSVVAISADGTEGRAAEMRFTRGTEHRGDVKAAPPDPQPAV